jgi:hypothetical protein
MSCGIGRSPVWKEGTNCASPGSQTQGLAPLQRRRSHSSMRKEHKIHEMMERTIAATLDRGGPHYRELRELFHVLHMAYHEGKKLFDELVDEDEQ